MLCGIVVALVATIRMQDAWLNGLVATAHPVGLACFDMCLFVGWLVGCCRHTHNYERTLTIVDNQPNMRDGSTNSTYVNPTSPFYVTAGAAGDIEIQGHHFMQQPDWSITRISVRWLLSTVCFRARACDVQWLADRRSRTRTTRSTPATVM